MEPVDVRMRCQKWGWIGHTLRKDEKCIARKAMEWNPLISAGRLPERPRETWRRTVHRQRLKDEKCIARKAMEWNPLISAGRLLGRPRETWRRTVHRQKLE